jgi:cytochrome c biogenesis protein CcmG, thiol:disulfide interchange protein DsbE
MKDERHSAAGGSGGWRWGHPSALASVLSLRRRRGGRWTLLAAVLGGIALLTLLLAFGLRRDPSVVTSALIGRPAPTFDLASLDGTSRVRLADLRGQVVVVNFWGSWCQGCRQEHDALAAAWQRYRDQGVVFVGVSFQDAPSASKAFAQELRMDWPLVLDQSSRTAMAYGVYGAPETFFISRQGVVERRWIGPIDYETLTDEITRLQGAGASR